MTCAFRLLALPSGNEPKARAWKHTSYSNDVELVARINIYIDRSSESKLEAYALRHVALLSKSAFKIHVHYEWRLRAIQAHVPSIASPQIRNVEVPYLTQQRSRLGRKSRLLTRFFKKKSIAENQQNQTSAFKHSIPGIKTFELTMSSSRAISISSSEDLREHLNMKKVVQNYASNFLMVFPVMCLYLRGCQWC